MISKGANKSELFKLFEKSETELTTIGSFSESTGSTITFYSYFPNLLKSQSEASPHIISYVSKTND